MWLPMCSLGHHSLSLTTCAEVQLDPQAQELQAQIMAGTAPEGWMLVDGLLLISEMALRS